MGASQRRPCDAGRNARDALGDWEREQHAKTGGGAEPEPSANAAAGAQPAAGEVHRDGDVFAAAAFAPPVATAAAAARGAPGAAAAEAAEAFAASAPAPAEARAAAPAIASARLVRDQRHLPPAASEASPAAVSGASRPTPGVHQLLLCGVRALVLPRMGPSSGPL